MTDTKTIPAPSIQVATPSRVAVHALLALVALPVLTAVGANVRIPTELGVPFTLQTLFVVLSGAWLGRAWGPVSMLAYLGYGLIGLPFFTQGDGTGSLAYLMGATGGYLLAFPVAAWFVGLLRPRARRLASRALLLFAGSLLILASGSLFIWLGHGDTALATSLFVKFLPFAVVKAVLGAAMWRPRGS